MTTATEISTCPRCQKMIAARTLITETAEGVVHHHCGTASERKAPTDFAASSQRSRQTAERADRRSEPSRPSHRTWKWRGHLSLDC